jgi:hypothetical protein
VIGRWVIRRSSGDRDRLAACLPGGVPTMANYTAQLLYESVKKFAEG